MNHIPSKEGGDAGAIFQKSAYLQTYTKLLCLWHVLCVFPLFEFFVLVLCVMISILFRDFSRWVEVDQIRLREPHARARTVTIRRRLGETSHSDQLSREILLIRIKITPNYRSLRMLQRTHTVRKRPLSVIDFKITEKVSPFTPRILPMTRKCTRICQHIK